MWLHSVRRSFLAEGKPSATRRVTWRTDGMAPPDAKRNQSSPAHNEKKLPEPPRLRELFFVVGWTRLVPLRIPRGHPVLAPGYPASCGWFGFNQVRTI